ncbi:hypothetical protein OHA57_38985 (plasmid) [Streptomyces anulatus]|uniref:hotdog domain-containing protein n=1 Tax=Streptomyces anulatus TaxID=1892 RepID=UPI002DDA15FB|nr:hotdog domain-containing protein [Streptomyces anulatus]WSC66958.1 hypothetical protein OHA57_38985 [Streptomyces anulatus]
MKLIDDAAAAFAGRHADDPAVTVSVDRMTFLAPARAGDLTTAHAGPRWRSSSTPPRNAGTQRPGPPSKWPPTG